MKKNDEEQGAARLQCVREILLGGGVALLLCMLLLLLASWAIAGGLLQEAMGLQITVLIGVVASFGGAMFAIGRSGAGGLPVGLFTGAVFFLLLLTVGLIFFGPPDLEEKTLALFCACLCGGGAAGLLAGRGKGKKRRSGGRRRGR